MQHIIEQYEAILRKIDEIKQPAVKESRNLNAAELEKVNALTRESDALGHQVEAWTAMNKTEQDLARAKGAFTAAPTKKPDYSKKDNKDRDQASFAKIVRAIALQGQGARFDGAEKEAVDEGMNEARGLPSQGGIFISRDYLERMMMKNPQFRAKMGLNRAYTATGQTSVDGDQGGINIQTDVAQAIGGLFAPNWLDTLGATRMSGLVGNLRLPRHVLGTNPAHKTENAASDAYVSTFTSQTMQPHRLPTYVDVSRQEMEQVPYIESFVVGDITKQLGNAMEQAIINGVTAGPTGIMGDSTISLASSTSNALTYLNLRSFERTLKNKNAFQGNVGYLGSNDVAYKLQTTAKLLTGQSTSTYPVSLMEEEGKLNGYPAYFTKNVSSTISSTLTALILANWNDLVIGNWSGIEIIPDMVTQAATGYMRIHFAVYYDAIVRRPDSFLICKDITAA